MKLHEITFDNSTIDSVKLELFKKYIVPFLWEGTLFVNGGWGNKNKILELATDDIITGVKLPLLVDPKCELTDEGTPKNEHYSISFPGIAWRHLLILIDNIQKLDCEQRYLLKSFVSSNVPDSGTDIFELYIVSNKDKTTLRVNKGKWVPSFDDSEPVAHWSR